MGGRLVTTRDHLIYQLQVLYAFDRDVLPIMDSMIHEDGNAELRQILQRQHDGIKGELEPLERALNLLGAQYKMERSPITPALKEALERFKHQMNPAQDQLDIHALLLMMHTSHVIISEYKGGIELARAVGEQDVVTLLEENCQRHTAGLNEMENFAPTLIQQVSRQEINRAA